MNAQDSLAGTLLFYLNLYIIIVDFSLGYNRGGLVNFKQQKIIEKLNQLGKEKIKDLLLHANDYYNSISIGTVVRALDSNIINAEAVTPNQLVNMILKLSVNHGQDSMLGAFAEIGHPVKELLSGEDYSRYLQILKLCQEQALQNNDDLLANFYHAKINNLVEDNTSLTDFQEHLQFFRAGIFFSSKIAPKQQVPDDLIDQIGKFISGEEAHMLDRVVEVQVGGGFKLKVD